MSAKTLLRMIRALLSFVVLAVGVVVLALTIFAAKLLHALKVASTPKIAQLLTVLGLATVVYLLITEDKTRDFQLHAYVCHAYFVVLIGYTLHFLEGYVEAVLNVVNLGIRILVKILWDIFGGI